MAVRRTTEEHTASGRTRAVARVGEEYRFGVVLLLLLLTFVFLISGPQATWIRPVTVTLQGATLLAALAAARTPVRWQHIARYFVLVCIAIAIAAQFSSGTVAEGATAILSGLLVAVAPAAIVKSIVQRRVIDARTVMGALCIYVLIGLMWAFAYTAIGAIQSRPFFAQTTHATTSDYTYFSFVTLTTVGYGDLSAAGHLGRALAVLEALFGQIYLVTIVALLVSKLGHRGRTDTPGNG
jgi:voltage-gated potassium channel